MNTPAHKVTSKMVSRHETGIPKKLWVIFSRWQTEANFQALARSCQHPHPQDLVLHQIFNYSPPTRNEIQSNSPRIPGPTTLGLNTDRSIKFLPDPPLCAPLDISREFDKRWMHFLFLISSLVFL